MPPKRRLSEGSEGPEEEEEAQAGQEEMAETPVRAGPGRPKKKKIDPSQQMQVIPR